MKHDFVARSTGKFLANWKEFLKRQSHFPVGNFPIEIVCSFYWSFAYLTAKPWTVVFASRRLSFFFFFAAGKMACAYSSADQKTVLRVCSSAEFANFWLLMDKIHSTMIVAHVWLAGWICGLPGALWEQELLFLPQRICRRRIFIKRTRRKRAYPPYIAIFLR